MSDKTFHLPPMPDSYDDDIRPDKDLVARRIAHAEQERLEQRQRPRREGEEKKECVPRSGKSLSNEEIYERELRAYAHFMQNQPQFGHPESKEKFDATMEVTDEDCFRGGRTCRNAEFYEAQLYQSRFNPYDPRNVDAIVGREIDPRRDIRDSRCN